MYFRCQLGKSINYCYLLTNDQKLLHTNLEIRPTLLTE